MVKRSRLKKGNLYESSEYANSRNEALKNFRNRRLKGVVPIKAYKGKDGWMHVMFAKVK
jgi:hypothetical protein